MTGLFLRNKKRSWSFRQHTRGEAADGEVINHINRISFGFVASVVAVTRRTRGNAWVYRGVRIHGCTGVYVYRGVQGCTYTWVYRGVRIHGCTGV